jgi:fatty acid amide hydrolase
MIPSGSESQLRPGSLTRLGAGELARLLGGGEVSAVEVIEAHIRRIEEVQPRLNAVVVPLFDRARAEAMAADAARARGEPLGPLHGVPFTVKEMFDVAGTPTTLGLTDWRDRIAAADAPLVRRLRGAGAILLGKTNVPQLGMIHETDNPLYGRTNNPANPDRATGGSTGGEAAVIAAGGSPLGLGTDAGGSIRQPCHWCGIHGLKPTAGRLPLRGLPLFPNCWPGWLQPGPMARSVADLHMALRVLNAPGTGPDEVAPPVPLGDPGAVGVSSLRVGFYVDDGRFTPGPAVRRAVHEAAVVLRDLGAVVEEFRPPDVAEAVRVYCGLFFADGLACVHRWLGKGKRDWRIQFLLTGAAVPTWLRPVLAWMLKQAGRRHEADFFRLVRRRTLSLAGYWELVEAQDAYRARFLAALDEKRLDVLLCPPNGLPAPPHGSLVPTYTSSYTQLYNVLGMPAGVVAATRVRPGEESDRPASRDPIEQASRAVEVGSTGLPVGVQVVARHWREDVALAVMAALEGHFRRQADYLLPTAR